MTERDKFVLSCPGCGRKLKAVEEHLRGRKGLCPACRLVFIMDEPPKLIEPNPGSGMPPPPVHTDSDATQIAPSAQPEAASTQTVDPAGTDTASQTPLHPTAASCPDATRLAAGSLPGTDNDATQMAGPFIPEKEPDATRLAGQAADTSQTDESRVPLVWQPGDRFLDIYRVDGILGQGAFGTVYRVRHLGWEVDLAVKTPNPEALDAHGAEIFTSEAETWSELGLHPHIVSCYYVRDLGGVPRVFAEYVDGGSLQESIEQGKAESLEQKLDIAIQFAWGLAYAHAMDLVHKDVKPANVMLTADGRVKVTDFGLTRAKGGHGGGEEVELGGGRTIMVDGAGCTPAYASPEQLSGQMVSRAADVWSWAVSILAMFTGGARWRVGVAAPTVLEGILQRPDGDTSVMPEPLAALLQDCFILDPVQRLRDMNEAADRLITVYQAATGKEYPRSAPRMDPSVSADSLVNRALSQLDLGDRESAISLLQQAIVLQPHHTEATYNLGLMRWRDGEITDMDLVLAMEEVQSTHTETWIDELCLGLVHMERGDFASAVAVLDSIDEEEGKNNTQVNAALQKSRELTDPASEQVIDCSDWGIEDSIERSDFNERCTRVIIQDGSYAKVHDVSSGKSIQRLLGGRWERDTAKYSGFDLVRFNKSGRLAVTGGRYHETRIWELETGKCLTAIDIGSGGALFTIDDRTILTYHQSPPVINEWETATGLCLRTLKGHEIPIVAMDMTPDGKTLITGELSGILKIWDLSSGKCRTTLQPSSETEKISADGHLMLTDKLNTLKISPDGSYALAIHTQQSEEDMMKIKIWDLQTKACVREADAGKGFFPRAAMHSRGNIAATVGWRSFQTRIWDVEHGRCLRTYDLKKMSIQSISMPPVNSGIAFVDSPEIEFVQFLRWGGTYLIRRKLVSVKAPWQLCRVSSSEAAHDAVKQFDVEMNKAQEYVKTGDFSSALQSLSIARSQAGQNRRSAAIAMSDLLAMRLPRRSLAGGWEIHNIKAHTQPVIAISVSLDGSYIISHAPSQFRSHDEGELKIWHSRSGECLREFDVKQEKLRVSSVSNFFNRLRNVKIGNIVKGHDVGDQTTTSILQGVILGSDKTSLEGIISPDGRLRCLTPWSHSTSAIEFHFGRRIWDQTAGAESRPKPLALGNDDAVLWYCRNRRKLIQWNSPTKETEKEFSFSGVEPRNLYLHPDGNRAFIAGDGEIVLYDLEKDQYIRRASVNTTGDLVSLTTDFRYALLGCAKNIELWDLQSMQMQRSFHGHHADVSTLTVSRDGSFFVSGDMEGKLRIWRLDWELEPRRPCDWDDAALPHVLNFLTHQRPRTWTLSPVPPYGLSLKTKKDVTDSLRRTGKPVWSEEDFNRLIYELQCAGLGYIRPEGIRSKLEELASAKA